jgi:hypothetical protein
MLFSDKHLTGSRVKVVRRTPVCMQKSCQGLLLQRQRRQRGAAMPSVNENSLSGEKETCSCVLRRIRESIVIIIVLVSALTLIKGWKICNGFRDVNRYGISYRFVIKF